VVPGKRNRDSGLGRAVLVGNQRYDNGERAIILVKEQGRGLEKGSALMSWEKIIEKSAAGGYAYFKTGEKVLKGREAASWGRAWD